MKLWLTLALPLFVLDQITKFAVLKTIQPHEVIPVIPGFFDLVQVHNRGAAFGMLRDHPWIFLILASVALVVLAVITITRRVSEPLTRVAVAVLASGVAGNLLDRLIHGHVIDFLSFDLHIPGANPWPAFNVADMCICVAAGLLIIASFLDGKKPKSASSLAS
jgi:signal peptidase II